MFWLRNKKIKFSLHTLNFQRKILNIFLPISFNICFGCSKEPSHRDGSFEYPQHMFWLRNKKVNFSLRTRNSNPKRGFFVIFQARYRQGHVKQAKISQAWMNHLCPMPSASENSTSGHCIFGNFRENFIFVKCV